MQDRSSKPHRIPGRTPEHVKKKIINLRWRLRLGPAQIAARLGLSTSTVHAVLVRCRVNRLSHIDRVTGEPLRRYEHPHPGSLIHVDVTKFGNIPDGGGHRYVGRQQGARNKLATPGLPRGKDHKPRTGTAFVHTVIDDHSRVAYAEIWSDEQASTAVGVLERAVAWFAERGVTVERVLSDNGSAYRSHAWRDFALGSASDTSGHAPTGRRRTGRSSDSTARSGTAGPMPGFTVQRPNDAWRCPAGSTSTTTTDTTLRLAAYPSTDSTTSLDITARAPPPGTATAG